MNKYLQNLDNYKEILIPTSILLAIGLNVYFDNNTIAKWDFQWRWVIAIVNLITFGIYYMFYLNKAIEEPVQDIKQEDKKEQVILIHEPQKEPKLKEIPKTIESEKKSPYGLVKEK